MSQVSASFRDPRIWIPFLVVTVIWGSTWIVIKDQLGVVPPSWSVTYRFLVAGIVMLGVALVTRVPMQIGWAGQRFAFALGVMQFMLNFNFVYRAELYVTSGLVAVVFALLFVPNAIMSRVFLKEDLSKRFMIGSAIAVAGIILLFINEAQGDQRNQTATLTGIGFTLAGVICASVSNVMMGTRIGKSFPMASLLGWSMIWGGAGNAVFAYISSGPPVVEWRLGYVVGIGYLGIIASALAFSLYFRTIRDIGAAKAAYSSVLIPVIAMAYSTALEAFHWTVLAIIGSVIALAGMVVALSGKRA